MTVMTNLVVALMIVTNGMESVKARVVNDSPPENEWIVSVCGPVETLYRKTCTTNFIYSADINVELLSAYCHVLGCNKRKQFTVKDIFGCPVESFFVRWDKPIFCKEHEKGKVEK